MSNKHFHDTERTARIIANIDAAERKLRMMKQYINPDTGTIRDTQVTSGLFWGAEECLENIRKDLEKFV